MVGRWQGLAEQRIGLQVPEPRRGCIDCSIPALISLMSEPREVSEVGGG